LDALSNGSGTYVNVTTANNALFNVTAGTKNAGTIDGTGTTTVDAGQTLIATHVTQSTVNANGTVKVRQNGTLTGTSKIGTLNTSTGNFDVTNNKVIITGNPAGVGAWNGTNYTGVLGQVAAGRGIGNNPTWNGNGLITSQTGAVPANGGVTTLAVSSPSQLQPIIGSLKTTFGGTSVGANDALVMYTWNGDANMDGKVNADDYFQIDSHYNKGSSAPANNGFKSWVNGDFNYDGVINGDDYALIDAGFAAQNAVFPAAPGVGGLSGVSAVPEPASVALLALGAGALGLRRRRK